MIRPKGECGKLMDWALREGWKRLGDARGHVRLLWPPTGDVVVIPGTPSDWRSMANTRSVMEKVSGVRQQRPPARRKSRKRVTGSGFDLRAVSDERRAEAEALHRDREELALVQGWLQGLDPNKRRSPAEMNEITKVRRRARQLKERLDGDD